MVRRHLGGAIWLRQAVEDAGLGPAFLLLRCGDFEAAARHAAQATDPLVDLDYACERMAIRREAIDRILELTTGETHSLRPVHGPIEISASRTGRSSTLIGVFELAARIHIASRLAQLIEAAGDRPRLN